MAAWDGPSQAKHSGEPRLRSPLFRQATLTNPSLRAAGFRHAITAVSGSTCESVVLGDGAADADQSVPSYLKDTFTLAR